MGRGQVAFGRPRTQAAEQAGSSVPRRTASRVRDAEDALEPSSGQWDSARRTVHDVGKVQVSENTTEEGQSLNE